MVKKALLIQCHSSTDEEESQSLLPAQPQVSQQPPSLAETLSDDGDGHGGEGEETSQTSSSMQAKRK